MEPFKNMPGAPADPPENPEETMQAPMAAPASEPQQHVAPSAVPPPHPAMESSMPAAATMTPAPAHELPATPASVMPSQPGTVVAPPADSSAAQSFQLPTMEPTPSTGTESGQAHVFINPDAPQPVAEAPKSGKKKKLVIGGVAALAVLLLASVGVFALYLPNTPQNVFKTGLSRTGKAADELVVAAADPKKLEAAVKNTDVSGSLEVKGPTGTYSGTFSSKYDTKQSDSNLKVKTEADGQSQTLGMDVLSDIADGQTYPSIYFRLSGLTSLGLDAFLPGISNYDNKWISISSDYIKQNLPAEAQDTQKKTDFTYKDASQLATIVSSKTREYVFSTDPDKAVLTQKQFVGKETIEGDMAANHYKVGINKTNAKKYCTDLITSVMSSEAYKKLPNIDTSNVAQDTKDAVKSCTESVDSDYKDSDTFDMWIDTHMKLVRKIRFEDSTEKGTYIEVGQTYKSGDEIPMYMNFHSDKDKYDANITLTANTKTNVTKGAVSGSTSGDDKYTVKGDFTIKPGAGDVKVQKPADAIPLEQVLQAFGLDPAALSEFSDTGASTTSATGQDTDRKNELRTLQQFLETYYNDNGFYPSLSDLNSTAWRKANMQGTSEGTLTDPSGASATLAATAAVGHYGYAARACSANQCQAYELSAVLSDDTIYKLQSVNDDTAITL